MYVVVSSVTKTYILHQLLTVLTSGGLLYQNMHIPKRRLWRQSCSIMIVGYMTLFFPVHYALQETLVAMAKAVASSTAALVSNARNVASKCDDQALQNQVIGAAKATALATQALIACTKVLSPTIDNPLCQEQLIEACKLVAAAVERIVIAAQVPTLTAPAHYYVAPFCACFLVILYYYSDCDVCILFVFHMCVCVLSLCMFPI